MGYTKIDNCWLDDTNELLNAEFRVMMILERLLTGFHRKSYVIKYSTISNMSGVANVYRVMKLLKAKGLVSFESKDGKASKIQINKPTKSVSRSSIKASNSVSTTIEVNDTDHSNNLYDPPLTKETFKESLNKDLFLEFKNKYPKEKYDDDTVINNWQSLTDEDKQLVIGVMEFQNNEWNDPNFDRQWIPYASNYLTKKRYLVDSVLKYYKNKLWREREAVERREYLKEADKNSATDDEKKAILSNWEKNK